MMRDNWRDWLKVVACVAMACDHLRFVSPAFAVLFFPGRIAMPLFAAVASLSFRSSKSREGYLRRLVPYAVVSEPLFFLLTGCFGNVLLLFLFAFAFVHYGKLIFAIAASCCVYSAGGLMALVCFSAGGVPQSALFFAAGLLLNGFPLSVVSAAAAILPTLSVSMPACPFVEGAALRVFYPAHLGLYLAAKYFCEFPIG